MKDTDWRGGLGTLYGNTHRSERSLWVRSGIAQAAEQGKVVVVSGLRQMLRTAKGRTTTLGDQFADVAGLFTVPLPEGCRTADSLDDAGEFTYAIDPAEIAGVVTVWRKK